MPTLAQVGSVPYYPNEKYIARNLAPEKFPLSSLRELAYAQRDAVKAGVLPSTLAQMMLPNALIEGRPDDFGVNEGFGYPPSPETDRRMQLMGLRVAQNDPKRLKNSPEFQSDVAKYGLQGAAERDHARQVQNYDVERMPGYSYNYVDDGEQRNPRVAARLAALVLAQKAKSFGEENAIERWNGKGRVMNGPDVADSKNHVRKVTEMQRMLAHPKNQTLRDIYMQFMNDAN